jgi:hypothetical protein
MNRPIFICLLSCFFWTVNLTSSLAKSADPASKVNNTRNNYVACNNHNNKMLNDTSLTVTDNTNETQASLDGLLGDNILLKNEFSKIKVVPSSGSYLGACNNDEYYIKISGEAFGDGEDISSVTICGAEVCQILIQSSNYVIVYPNSGTPGTGDIIITSKSKGKTVLENAFTYSVTPNK